ncbi:MAG: hypothetical protein PVG90_13470, partial [Bacillota bacterium]
MNFFKRKLVIVAIFCFCLLLTGIAAPVTLAVNAAAGGEVDGAGAGEDELNETAESAGYELDTVTVTAEKREENLQEVPGSVTALTEGQVEDAGIEKTEDIAAYTPNLHIVDF